MYSYIRFYIPNIAHNLSSVRVAGRHFVDCFAKGYVKNRKAGIDITRMIYLYSRLCLHYVYILYVYLVS